jgi:hypothetical protein
MSDETRMNPELEKFAAQLGQADLPAIKLDRDQLMYDAGWAAALAQRAPVPVSQPKSGLSTIAISFVSGLGVAAMLMLMLSPAVESTDGTGNDTMIAATSSEDPASDNSRPASADATDTVQKTQPEDLLAWLDDIPVGHSISSGFTTRPTTEVKLDAADTASRFDAPLILPASTNSELMRQLTPRKRAKPKLPAWSFLMFIGNV